MKASRKEWFKQCSFDMITGDYDHVQHVRPLVDCISSAVFVFTNNEMCYVGHVYNFKMESLIKMPLVNSLIVYFPHAKKQAPPYRSTPISMIR